MFRRLAPALLFAVTLAGTLAGCPGDGRTPVVVYSPHGRDLLTLLETNYEAAHPGVDVQWFDMGSQKIFERVKAEKANPQADVWFGGPDTIFARGASEGLLAAFAPTWAAQVPPESRDPGAFHHGVFRSMPVLVYNTQKVSPEAAPTDWDSLLEPRFQGRVLIRDPLESGTMRTFFGLILARSVSTTQSTEAGFKWLLRLDAQTKEYVNDPILMLTKVVRGEGWVTVWDLTDILLLRDKNNPIDYRFPTSGTPVIDDSIGLVAGASHAAEGRAFIEWVGSPEALRLAAKEAYRIPARTDLEPQDLPAWAQDVLTQLRSASYDAGLLQTHGQEWMATWDRTVRGRGASAATVNPSP